MSTRTTRARDAASAALASAVTALALSGGGYAESSRAQVAPRNERPPTISGDRNVGSTLTANPGQWAGTQPITFSYQWVRCNARLANCQNTGARGRSYRLGDDDLGGASSSS